MIERGDNLDIPSDPIAAANERQNEYWQRVGGRDPEPTYREGWREWYARIVEDAPE